MAELKWIDTNKEPPKLKAEGEVEESKSPQQVIDKKT